VDSPTAPNEKGCWDWFLAWRAGSTAAEDPLLCTGSSLAAAAEHQQILPDAAAVAVGVDERNERLAEGLAPVRRNSVGEGLHRTCAFYLVGPPCQR
jgi:hypothetical protein